MKGGYLAWQFWHAPYWLFELSWNLQRANFQLFSVPVMLKTLFSHWHRDALEYHGGTITSYLTTFALNQISRAIGFIIRAASLFAWAGVTVLLIMACVGGILLFVLWPLAPIFFMVLGLINLGGAL